MTPPFVHNRSRLHSAPRGRTTLIHRSSHNIARSGTAAQTPLHPQCPQALLLLLVYLSRIFFEEGHLGTHRTTGSPYRFDDPNVSAID